MIRLIKLCVVLVVIWSIWWWGAGFGLRQSLSAWFAAQESRGWQAEVSSMETGGFPLRHITTLTSPALADPATGTAWAADWLRLESPAAWPGRQNLFFAATPQRLSYFDQTVVIRAETLVARMHLHPGLALALDRMQATGGAWQVDGNAGPVMSAASLVLAMVQQEKPDTYQFEVEAEGFAPGARLRRLIGSAQSLPDYFKTLKLDMKVTFDQVWDRAALEQRRPQPVRIDLRLAELHWGNLRLLAAGKLEVDDQGIPKGAITIKVENWRDMLDMARASGAVPEQLYKTAERGLKMLASFGGNPKALDVQFNFADGFVALGPFPIGPAPRLIIR
ncbi:MAG: DUF2125 domain-containing protein [Rhodobacteraceae bacterium]|nr:DUF2125 domain-containing protein [Paracoccaceae bacterium]